MSPGPKYEEVIKTLCKRTLGEKMNVNGIEIDKPTSLYSTEQMTAFVQKIVAWAATDLQLEIHI